MSTPTDKNLEILDAIFHEAALVDAEDGTSTAEERQRADALRAHLQARVAERRREMVPDAPVTRGKPIRAAFLAMARDALLAKIEEITQRMGGTVQVAHRKLSGLSDDDLRRLLETLDPDPDPDHDAE